MHSLPDYSILGYSQWKPGQEQAVSSFWQNKDTVVVMPTGGGKSACYQIPALAGEGLTVVFSPLQSLMKDQVGKINSNGGQTAACWIGDMSSEQVLAMKQSVKSGETKLLYIAPERLNYESFYNLIKDKQIPRVVVDEAHCVSKWGNKFRPEYLKIQEWIASLPTRPTIMAATASASQRVLRDIIQKLGMDNPEQIHMGFNRPNITIDKILLQGEGVNSRLHKLLSENLIKEEFLPAIVYAGTQKEVMELCDRLLAEGINASPYHRGLSSAVKEQNAERFTKGQTKVLVATNAFGMGIDIAGIRSVWHTKWPVSFEDWYQEFGRAGRDGEPAKAILCAPKHDIKRVERMLSSPEDDQETSAKIKQQVGQLWDLFEQENCLRKMILDFFDDPSEAEFLQRCCSNCSPPDWLDNLEEIMQPKKVAAKKFVSKPVQTAEHAPVFFFKSGKAQVAQASTQSEDVQIDQLKAWRKSRAAGKPAYTVCNDKALYAIAQEMPKNAQQLLSMPGIGPAFVEKHASSLLSLLKVLQ